MIKWRSKNIPHHNGKGLQMHIFPSSSEP